MAESKLEVVEKVYDLDAATNYTHCKTSFENFGGQRIGVGTAQDAAGSQGWKEVICPACDRDERIHEYKTTGEMSSRLVTEAMMAHLHLVEYNDDSLHRIRPEIAASWTANRDMLLKIAEKNEKITKRARTNYKVSTTSYRLVGTVPKPTHTRPCSGAAGRVLLTLQDRYPQGNPQSKFGGAWITLIFDETADHCRDGVQGYCATFEEAMGLLNAAFDNFPALKRDDEVYLFGM